MALTHPSRDPTVRAPVGSYQTDGHQLVQILESDSTGACGEDALTGTLVEISPIDLMQRWRRVTPQADKEKT